MALPATWPSPAAGWHGGREGRREGDPGQHKAHPAPEALFAAGPPPSRARPSRAGSPAATPVPVPSSGPRPRPAAAAPHLGFPSLQLLQPLLVLHGARAGTAARYRRREAGPLRPQPGHAACLRRPVPSPTRLTATAAAAQGPPAPPSSSPRKHAAGESDVRIARSSSRRHPSSCPALPFPAGWRPPGSRLCPAQPLLGEDRRGLPHLTPKHESL